MESKERRFDSPTVGIGQKMQKVAREKSGPDTQSILQDWRDVAIDRRPVKQGRKVNAGGNRQVERAPKLRVDLDELCDPIARINLEFNHRDARPSELP